MKRLLASAVSLSLVLAGAPLPAAGLPEAGAGYQPADKDERGLWSQMQEQERLLRASNFVIRDEALNAYVRSVFCRTVGEDQCRDIRIYIVRTPHFNASMAPNGMMEIWSGMFLRLRNEAQLAAVLGHEYGHFEHRHTLQLFRDVRGKAGAAAWLSMFGLAGSIVSLGLISSIYSFSREMEAQADSDSVELLAKAGYDPLAASKIWEQLRAEMDATAVARNAKSRKDKNGGIFGTHPPTAERVAALKLAAEKLAIPRDGRFVGREAYQAALAGFWPRFIDDQIKLNDFGGTDFLLDALAKDGPTGTLLFARGELYRARARPEDLALAADSYRKATAMLDAPVESWRGLGLALLRSGQVDEGRDALRHFLALRPDAPDAAMLRSLTGEKS